MMLATGLFSITLFVDRLFLYRYSDAAAAAAMSSGTLFWSVTCLPVGICGYTNTFVSQYLEWVDWIEPCTPYGKGCC